PDDAVRVVVAPVAGSGGRALDLLVKVRAARVAGGADRADHGPLADTGVDVRGGAEVAEVAGHHPAAGVVGDPHVVAGAGRVPATGDASGTAGADERAGRLGEVHAR